MNKRQKLSLWIAGIFISGIWIIWTIDQIRYELYPEYRYFIVPVIILTGILFVTK